MHENLFEEFTRFHGQPVRIFTDDRRTHCGIVLEPFESSVRIIDECSRLNLIEFCHIVAVEEPQMRLHRCHEHLCCEEPEHEPECEHEHEHEEECGRRERRERR